MELKGARQYQQQATKMLVRPKLTKGLTKLRVPESKMLVLDDENWYSGTMQFNSQDNVNH